MTTEFSTLQREPDRLRIWTNDRSRLLFGPVEVVDERAVEGGRELIIRSATVPARVVIAADDQVSNDITAELNRVAVAVGELDAIRARIELASQPVDPSVVRVSNAQIRQRQALERRRRSIRTNALAAAALLAIATIFATLAR